MPLFDEHLVYGDGTTRTMDATGNGAPVTQYYGCWVVDFYQRSRTHLALGKDAPVGRAVQLTGCIVVRPEVGGLHHRYERQAA